jgi:hypothetical protein
LQFEFSHVRFVSLYIVCKFLVPEIHTGFWRGCFDAASMAVPKTAMDKYDLLQGRKNNIGMSGQFLPMQPESKSQSMSCTSDLKLRFCVSASNLGHQAASRRRNDFISALSWYWIALTSRHKTPNT